MWFDAIEMHFRLLQGLVLMLSLPGFYTSQQHPFGPSISILIFPSYAIYQPAILHLSVISSAVFTPLDGSLLQLWQHRRGPEIALHQAVG